MFNNAGIALCGEVRDMDLEHWRRILDVNLWGVIYGTTAVYQVMVRQGFGHAHRPARRQTGQALRLCPQAIVLSPRHKVYGEYSARMMAILSEYR